jgi:hypothetical protein
MRDFETPFSYAPIPYTRRHIRSGAVPLFPAASFCLVRVRHLRGHPNRLSCHGSPLPAYGLSGDVHNLLVSWERCK